MCNKKWILYDNWWLPAQCLDWEETPKHFPKPNLHLRKVMITAWWFAASLIHYSFLNPSKTITSEKYIQQINEKPWKPATSSASTGQQNGPNSFMTMSNHTSHNQCFKVEQSWAIKFYLIHIFTDLSPTDYHIFKDQENASTTRRKQKMLSKRLWNLEEWIFTL